MRETQLAMKPVLGITSARSQSNEELIREVLIMLGRKAVAAMRAGKYRQIKGRENDGVGGVCAVGAIAAEYREMQGIYYLAGALEHACYRLTRMYVKNTDGHSCCLPTLNDDHDWTFNQLADAIEWYIGDVEKVPWMIDAGWMVTPAYPQPDGPTSGSTAPPTP